MSQKVLKTYNSKGKLVESVVTTQLHEASDGFGPMHVRVKKLDPKAVVPKYAKLGDAGLDLTAVSKEYDNEAGNLIFGTGLSFEIPRGYVGLIFPRSSVVKTPLILGNCVGVVDSGYRGEVKAVFKILDRPRQNYEVGDRIAQLIIMPYPEVKLIESDSLSDTERGDGGFGSSGA